MNVLETCQHMLKPIVHSLTPTHSPSHAHTHTHNLHTRFTSQSMTLNNFERIIINEVITFTFESLNGLEKNSSDSHLIFINRQLHTFSVSSKRGCMYLRSYSSWNMHGISLELHQCVSFTLCITRKAQQGGSLERLLFVHVEWASKLIMKRGNKDGRNVQKRWRKKTWTYKIKEYVYGVERTKKEGKKEKGYEKEKREQGNKISTCYPTS